jgi:hypothetical protein
MKLQDDKDLVPEISNYLNLKASFDSSPARVAVEQSFKGEPPHVGCDSEIYFKALFFDS